MQLTGERLIPAPVATTWQALNDPAVLKDCIAGCESLEKTGDDAYAAVVAFKVGPIGARFQGGLKLTDVRPPGGYTIHFEGQGGAAGFGRGSADVSLAPDGDGATRLAYTAQAQVGGRIAQLGSRLIDAAAAKITADFFKAFEARVTSQEAQGGSAAAATAPAADAAPEA